MKIIDTLSKFQSPIIHFFLTFILLSMVYRGWFYYDLQSVIGIPLASAKVAFCYGVINDFKMATVISAIFIGIQFLFARIIAFFPRFFSLVGLLLIYIFLLMSAFLFAAQHTIFVALFSDLTVGMIKEAFLAFNVDSFTSNITGSQWLFLLFPLVLFTLFRWINQAHVLLFKFIIVLPLLFLTGIYGYIGLHSKNYNNMYSPTFKSNPYTILLNDLLKTRINRYTKMQELPSDKQMRSVALIDPEFVSDKIISPEIVLSENPSVKNVILIILESTGKNYIFDTSCGNQLPMPFLQRLFKEGVELKNHYATGNSSPPGLFSLFSGLYPKPSGDRFEMRRNNQLPSIASWLPSSYAKFIVTPGSTDYYMPVNFLKNSGFTLYGQRDIPVKRHDNTLPNYLNEMDAMDFFIQKIQSTTTPFFAVYYTGVPHAPYVDYGPEWRIFSDTKEDINRYYNGLFMLDAQLKRIEDALKEKNLQDKTLWVIVADHGEGFGQHPEEWRHGATLFSEEMLIPGLLYQPALFKPQVVNANTSNVDILPTVLDSIGIHYDASLIQGQSLVKSHPARSYIFLYGLRKRIVGAINQNNIKLQVDFSNGTCTVYDLNHDPEEFHPLSCDDYQAQLKDVVRYRHYQTKILR